MKGWGYIARTHGGTKTTIDLEHGKLIEAVGVFGGHKGAVGNDLVFARGFDAVPVASRSKIR